jgi:hypothetical protein
MPTADVCKVCCIDRIAEKRTSSAKYGKKQLQKMVAELQIWKKYGIALK